MRTNFGKPEGKRPLRRHRHRWVDNTELDLRETVLECMDWIHLAQDMAGYRVLVNTVMNLRVSIKAGNLLARQA
jgi:hypothetical protein